MRCLGARRIVAGQLFAIDCPQLTKQECIEQSGHVQDGGFGLFRETGQNGLHVLGYVSARLDRNGLTYQANALRRVTLHQGGVLQRSQQNPAHYAHVRHALEKLFGSTQVGTNQK